MVFYFVIILFFHTFLLSRSRLQRLHSCFGIIRLRTMFERTSTFTHVRLILVAEQLDAADNRTGGGITKRTEGLPTDIITDIQHQIDIMLLPVSMLDALQAIGQ